jgi:hypothetical protein
MGTGTCVPRASVNSADVDKLPVDTCGDALLCAPTGLAESDAYVAPTCHAFGQNEGRCLPACLPDVAKRSDYLRQDDCDAGNLCVPCFDPVTSDATDACKLGGDTGAAEPPLPFASCCNGRARCIPESIIDLERRDELAHDSCNSQVPSLCVPTVWVDDPHAVPSSCRAYGNAEGRCLSECLAEVGERSEQLRQDSCVAGEKCVPCFDPISGEASNACTFGDDAPKEKPRLFDHCCGDVGACVPTEAISSDDRGRLNRDSCKSSDTMCVPRAWIALDRKPPAQCRSYGNAEGRCLERCLPDVAKRSEHLRQDKCDNTELCVPCFDPLTGEDTGACSIGGDPGPKDDPLLFGTCCGDRGRCVPTDAVDKSARGELNDKGCEGEASLCVPSPWLSDPPVVPLTCHGFGGAEGRCMPECLPDVANRLNKLKQDVCGAGDRCVPCFDPLTGESTGSCTIDGDTAKEPAQRFANCCGALGACVPSDALESDDRGRLDGSECGDALCAPKAWIQDDRTVPTDCRAYGDIEARCLPSCLPDVAKRADKLQQQTCAEAYLCVPCFDPVTLESTRACNIGQDLPRELPKPFSNCCDGIGRCIPQSLVREGDRERLNANTCEQSELLPRLCVPEAWVRSDRFVPGSCVAPGAVEGRCLPECLPDVVSRADQLTTSGCAAKHLCVPCFDPVTGQDTHACAIGDDKPPAQPTVWPSCCGGVGVCVPSEQVETADRSRLGADTCTAGSQTLCAPRSWVGANRSKPRMCSSYDGAEGRCMPNCLPDVASQSSKLKQDSCAQAELCVPCYDPVDGQDTQACRVAGDAPVQPPLLFSSCCENLGRCIPTALVDAGDRMSLAADSCSAADHLCAPSEWLSDERTAAATCHGLVAAEGRCLPNCLPDVSKQRGRLLQDTCTINKSCVPCFDPITGVDTGACSQPGDLGPVEDKRVFDKCCHGAARCVPSSAIGASDRSRLTKDDCDTPADALCVPNEWLQGGAHNAAPICRSPGNIEGRCWLSCLADVAKRADQLAQTTCAKENLCVPCFDPLNGASTGACTQNGDAAKEPPKLFPGCCAGEGTCVPGDLLDDTGGLNQESCVDPESYCVPSAAARGQDPLFSACSSTFGRGACVKTCFIDPGRRGWINRDRCLNTQLCVPCGSLDTDTAACGDFD